MAQQIVFTVGADGSIEVDATQGYRGRKCLDDTAVVVKALAEMGIVVDASQIRLVGVEEVAGHGHVANSS